MPVLEEIPRWLCYTDAELAEAAATTTKQRPNSTTKELAALAGILPKVIRIFYFSLQQGTADL